MTVYEVIRIEEEVVKTFDDPNDAMADCAARNQHSTYKYIIRPKKETGFSLTRYKHTAYNHRVQYLIDTVENMTSRDAVDILREEKVFLPEEGIIIPDGVVAKVVKMPWPADLKVKMIERII